MRDSEVLAQYDRDCRMREFSEDHTFAWDGPVFRMAGTSAHDYDNGVLYSRFDDNDAVAVIEAAISSQVAHFSAIGHAFEWKYHDHDGPACLPDRLAHAGFVASPIETLVVADLERSFSVRPLPDGVEIVHLEDPDEFDALGTVNATVNGDAEHAAWLVEALRSEKRAAPDTLQAYIARVDGAPVSTGWLRLPADSSFASLWGGSTLVEWQRHGIYTNLVARRMADARARGFCWLTVDCSEKSLPLLVRRGFEKLAVITPWIWRPTAT